MFSKLKLKKISIIVSAERHVTQGAVNMALFNRKEYSSFMGISDDNDVDEKSGNTKASTLARKERPSHFLSVFHIHWMKHEAYFISSRPEVRK